VVVCAGTLHSALEVQKVHTYRLDAFDSGDAGPLGYVEEGCVRLLRNWPTATSAAQDVFDRVAETVEWPRVEILVSHADARGSIIDALLRERESGSVEPLRGLVLAATGNGTLHHELEAAALRAQAAGVAVVRATRCAQGRILPRQNELLRDAGALTPVKARIELMLEVLAGRPADR
jgi:L-asparaginase